MLMPMKLGLAVAALSIAAVSSAGAAVNPASADPTSAVTAPAKPAFEMQAQQKRFKCQEDLGYGRTGVFGCG
jgi:hypothetical protein